MQSYAYPEIGPLWRSYILSKPSFQPHHSETVLMFPKIGWAPPPHRLFDHLSIEIKHGDFGIPHFKEAPMETRM